MNFTKGYIDLCKFKEIQRLRPKLEKGDWYVDMDYYMKEKEIMLYDYDFEVNREPLIWLPIGDNLDAEIVKICKENKWCYSYFCVASDTFFSISAQKSDSGRNDITFENTNPLIAKIHLLIKLLEEK
jgi:hypothetical protein